MRRAGQRMALADLRQQVERLNGGARHHPVLPFGVAALDRHLPGVGLSLGALHEVVEGGPAAEFAGAATLFLAGIVARLTGPVLWCLTRRDLFAPGLARAGLHPDRVIYAETLREREILPVMKERLREPGLAAVVGEVTRLGLTASRRLQLAAEASSVPAFVLRRWWTVAERDLTTLPAAAMTRWRIAPYASLAPPTPDGVGGRAPKRRKLAIRDLTELTAAVSLASCCRAHARGGLYRGRSRRSPHRLSAQHPFSQCESARVVLPEL
jgi:protein ImuA